MLLSLAFRAPASDLSYGSHLPSESLQKAEEAVDLLIHRKGHVTWVSEVFGAFQCTPLFGNMERTLGSWQAIIEGAATSIIVVPTDWGLLYD